MDVGSKTTNSTPTTSNSYQTVTERITTTMDYPLSSTYGARSSLFLQSADDYHRHRHRVNKRLNKLRRSLNIQTKDTKHYAEKEKISSISAENYDMDTKFGDVILFQIERDLLYAEETRLLLSVHSSKSKERFLVTKYKKALQHSKKLLSITSNEANQDKSLELLIYIAIVEGYLSVSRKKWSNSINAFAIARLSLQFLYKYEALPEAHTKELYLDIIDNIIDPALSLSLTQSSIKSTTNFSLISKKAANDNNIDYLEKAVAIITKKDPSFIKIASDEDSSSDKLIDSIKWLNYEATLESDELAKAIMKSTAEESKIKESDPSTYDNTLISWQDALTIHNQNMERSAVNDMDVDDDENQDKYIISTYLNYNYLLLRIRRDISLFDNISKKKLVTRNSLLENSRDSLKLLENAVKSVEEIKELPGVANDDDLTDSLDKLELYFKSLKIYKLSYAYLISNKYKESLALLNQSNKLINSKDSSLPIEFDGNLPTSSKISTLKKILKLQLDKVQVLTIYANEISSSSVIPNNEYIIDNINKFPEFSSDQLLSKVASLDILVQPVNVKPVLFDTAFNYISYSDHPELNDGEETSFVSTAPTSVNESDDGKKKKGFFGLFGR